VQREETGLSGRAVFAPRRGATRDNQVSFLFPLVHQAVNLRQKSDEKDNPAKQDTKKNGGYVLGKF